MATPSLAELERKAWKPIEQISGEERVVQCWHSIHKYPETVFHDDIPLESEFMKRRRYTHWREVPAGPNEEGNVAP